MTNLALFGAAGRMGQALIHAVQHQPAARLVGAIDRVEAVISDTLRISPVWPDQLDVLIDFTRPEATLLALEECLRRNVGMVIGTTGFSPEQLGAVQAAAKQIPICLSGNFSIGVNVALQLVEQAARQLQGFDIEIVEAHHRHKVDAPSGTALMLGEAAALGAGRVLKDVAVYERHGHTGARDSQSIGFSTVRGGDVVGDHTVLFLGEGERVEITHKASNRSNFAQGAVRAALWLHGQPAGLYSMRDVLA
jgi:4-hydroxy-tetrahydrodipicolinate reductase